MVEFSPYYSNLAKQGICEPLMHEHGCVFFDNDDWDQAEWNKFDSFMIHCVEVYLKYGLQQAEPVGLVMNRLIQTTSDEFADGTKKVDLPRNQWVDTKDSFLDFKETYLSGDDDLKQKSFTTWLKRYCDIHELDWEVRRSNGRQQFKLKRGDLSTIGTSVEGENHINTSVAKSL